ncbi:MAG: hypothetical protein E7038_09500 [Lentisphaerae bacterium]|nr:hypothetical protein [Lentisphaerota bacterium]
MRKICFLLTLLFLCSAVLSAQTTRKVSLSSGRAAALPATYRPQSGEFRGIWVATVQSIDFGKNKTAAGFRNEFSVLLKNIRDAGFTALIFQVRPMNDAFYLSALNPISRWMTGTEGKRFSDEPGFDPLAYMIRETHRAGLEFHAWLNPYRVANKVQMRKQDYLKTLASNNFATRNPSCVLAVPNGKTFDLILDPGLPAVRKYLCVTVQEIINQYDVDAIHFDDYFYPYTPMGNADATTYKRFAQQGESLEDWRRRNVNTLIREVHEVIKQQNLRYDRKIRFGISPFGIWANNRPVKRTNRHDPDFRKEGSATAGGQSYFRQYADCIKWVREGWIDYIVPQLYWSFDHKDAPYGVLAEWWVQTVRRNNPRVALYIGHGVYQCGTAADWKAPDELTDQVLFNQSLGIRGSVFFSYTRIFRPDNAAQKRASRKLIRDFWKKHYPVQ